MIIKRLDGSNSALRGVKGVVVDIPGEAAGGGGNAKERVSIF